MSSSTTSRLHPHSHTEVMLLSYLDLEQRMTLQQPIMSTKRAWGAHFDQMYDRIHVTVRTLISSDELRQLRVQRIGKDGSKASRWSPSYKMVQDVYATCVVGVRGWVMSLTMDDCMQRLESRIYRFRDELDAIGHEYVLNFTRFPCMLTSIAWQDEEDTTTDESEPISEQLDDEEEEEDDDKPSNPPSSAFAQLFGGKGSHAPELLIMLGGAGGARARNVRNAKTPLEKQFWELLQSRKKGDRTSEGSFLQDECDDTQKQQLIDTLTSVNAEKSGKPLLFRILQSHLPAAVKNQLMTQIESSRGEESSKFMKLLNGVLELPLNVYIEPKHVQAVKHSPTKYEAFLRESRAHLDSVVYGHDHAKDELVRYIAQMTRQSQVPDATGKGLVLGIQGPFGNGKTTMIEKGVSKVLGLPFAAIPLGGASDGAFLNGHSYTYEGSTWGQIADVLMKTKCCNPIIYLDELDKVSESYKGREVINMLVHLIDPSQNTHFQDRYFGNIDIDLSKVTWVFSYNDRGAIPPVLRDRITEVRTHGFTLPQKLDICDQFLVPSICREIGMPRVTFPSDVVKHLIETYTWEGGVRTIKKHLFEICRDLNKDDLCGLVQLATKRRRTTRTNTPSKASNAKAYVVTMDTALACIQRHHTPIVPERVHDTPTVGRINGLYASSGVDMGGIIGIETHLVPSDQTYGLSLTGNLLKVMQESGSVAKTLAWRAVSDTTQRAHEQRWKDAKKSIHVHCPDGAVTKDGPSAGTALTVAMVSLLTNNPIRHDVAITGEINLSGDVTAIGGLRSKLYGAKHAGCTLALFPKTNQADYDKIAKDCPDLFDDTFRAQPVSTLQEVLPHVLLSSDGLRAPFAFTKKPANTKPTHPTGSGAKVGVKRGRDGVTAQVTRRRSARLSRGRV